MVSLRDKSKEVRQRASQAVSKCRDLRSTAAAAVYASHQLISCPVTSSEEPTVNTASFAVAIETIASALKVDLQVGSTLATIASQARGEVKRQRNQRNARLAYDTVFHKAQTTALSETDRSEIDSQLANLRTALTALGEAF